MVKVFAAAFDLPGPKVNGFCAQAGLWRIPVKGGASGPLFSVFIDGHPMADRFGSRRLPQARVHPPGFSFCPLHKPLIAVNQTGTIDS